MSSRYRWFKTRVSDKYWRWDTHDNRADWVKMDTLEVCNFSGFGIDYAEETEDWTEIPDPTAQVSEKEEVPWQSEHGWKDTNPKDAVGVTKPPVHNVPLSVITEVGMALNEGEWKYGGYNWRVVGVRGSVYWDAAYRHLSAWWEGEDDDPQTGLSHITKAISALMVLRDAMIQGKFNDDRPPRSLQSPAVELGRFRGMQTRLKADFPTAAEGFTQKGLDSGT